MFWTLSRFRAPPVDMDSGVGRAGTDVSGRGVTGTGVIVAGGMGVGAPAGVEVGSGAGVRRSPARGEGVGITLALGVAVGEGTDVAVETGVAVGSGSGGPPQATDSSMTRPKANFDGIEMYLEVIPRPYLFPSVRKSWTSICLSSLCLLWAGTPQP